MEKLIPPQSTDSIEAALTQLVMHCPELRDLETRLSQFNIFRVLRADRNELRHSNMLAWFFNPDESHGLGDLFLRRWLMGTLQNASTAPQKPIGWISPIVVDVLDIERVEVRREFENIDLLFVIHTKKGNPWVICIENKVDSIQGDNQLKRYHEVVERHFANAERRIYVFLTVHHEPPAHPDYIESSYEDVFKTLTQCLAEREDSIGADPRFLIRHYLQLLEEDFMDENKSSELARQIYLSHRVALDYIFENKVDPIFEATNALEIALSSNADKLGIVMARTGKGWVRFLPKAWDVPNNSGGKAWGPNSRYLVCEVGLWSKKAELHITAGRVPEDWANLLWGRAAHEPFRQEVKTRPIALIKPFKAKSDIAVDSLGGLDDEETATRLLDWLKQELAKDKFKEAVKILSDLLKELRPA